MEWPQDVCIEPLGPPHVFMEWPQGLCMEPLGPPSCMHGLATRLVYEATRRPPDVFMDWPRGLCIEPLGPPLMYSWNGHKAYV